MSITRFLPRLHLTGRSLNPFGSQAPVAPPHQTELNASLPEARPAPSRPARRAGRSWFGWLFGNSRRTEPARLIQTELLLQKVKPVRNDFRDEAPAGARPKPTVLWETPAKEAPSDDQHHAWNRLRNRRPASMVVNAE